MEYLPYFPPKFTSFIRNPDGWPLGALPGLDKVEIRERIFNGAIFRVQTHPPSDLQRSHFHMGAVTLDNNNARFGHMVQLAVLFHVITDVRV